MRRSLLVFLLLCCAVMSRAATPTTLQVVDLRWIQGQPELETWLGALEGLVNRQEGDAAAFMVRNDDDAAWADALVRTYRLKKEVLTPGAFLEAYRQALTGQVLYDPAHPWTRDIALTAAAVSPGMVLPTDKDLGLQTMLDLRTGWTDRAQAYTRAAGQFRQPADANALVLAPESGHLLADLITSRKLPAVGLSPLNAQDAALLQRLLAALPPGGTVIGHPGVDNIEVAAVQQRLLQLHGNRPLNYLPACFAANLSCFARFPVTRPLLQGRNEMPPLTSASTITFIYTLGNTVENSTRSLDYAETDLRRLLDDLRQYQLPVGIEAPNALLDLAPAMYQQDIAWQRQTSAELIAAPGADATRARQMDLTAVSVQGEAGEWPTTAAMLGIANGGWQGAFLQPLARNDVPAWFGNNTLPANFQVISAGRAHSVEELRKALTVMTGPNQVIYLDPQSVPPAALNDLLPEIKRTHMLISPSQVLRAKGEIDALQAAAQASGKANFKRQPPTVQVSAPTADAQEIGDDRELHVAVRITGRVPVLAARLIYRAPDGRLGTADLQPGGASIWNAVLPPMLTGGDLVMQARVVETGGMGQQMSTPLVVKVKSGDLDHDGLSDTLEAYLGSDPGNPDTDGDGLPDNLDNDPTTPDRPIATFSDPLSPPIDAPYLADAGASTVDNGARVIPAGGAATYRLPVDGIPSAGALLRVQTLGGGTVSLNGAAPVALDAGPGSPAFTDVPLPAAPAGNGQVQVKLTAGAVPLKVLSLALISNPDGPFIRQPVFDPIYTAANVPTTVRVIAYSPRGIKMVRLRYGTDAEKQATLDLTPAEGGQGVTFTGVIPGQPSGGMLIYGVEAQDAAGHLSTTPYRALTVGRTKAHTVALNGGRNLHGAWQPAAIWGGLGRVSTAGAAEDTFLFLARPGTYTAWLLAQPRERGVAVSVTEEQSLTREVKTKLSKTAPAGSLDGWFRLGTFSVEASERLRIRMQPVGEKGYCAYGTLVFTQDAHFAPPLRNAGIDWYNSVSLSGLAAGQTVKGKVILTVQCTGNIDAVTVMAHQVRGPIRTPGDYTLELKDGVYPMDSRQMLPGDYDIIATGLRVVDDGDKRSIDELVTATVRVTIPAQQ